MTDLALCAWCGFLFDPRVYSFAYPYCGPRCAELGKAQRDPVPDKENFECTTPNS